MHRSHQVHVLGCCPPNREDEPNYHRSSDYELNWRNLHVDQDCELSLHPAKIEPSIFLIVVHIPLKFNRTGWPYHFLVYSLFNDGEFVTVRRHFYLKMAKKITSGNLFEMKLLAEA